MVRKIYITGCAKSGTTLLKRMFYAFKNVEINIEEVNVYDFVLNGESQCTLIAKRSEHTLFGSSRLRREEIAMQKELLRNVFVINIVRDGRAVLNSYLKDWGVNGSLDWCESLKQIDEHSSVIDLNIKYEDLLTRPNQIQRQIMKATGLKASKRFSQYPEFIDLEQSKEVDKDNYSLRPIDPSKVYFGDEWRLIKPNDREVFDYYLSKYNYI